MKKTVLAALLLTVVIFGVYSIGICQEKPAGSNKIVEAKRAELNDTTWAISITPIDQAGKGEADIISFAENKVSSGNLLAAGFPPSDFRLSVSEDGTVVWEAMQRSEKGDVMLWRGDINGGVMTGVLNRRDSEGKVTDFSFVGKK